MANGATDASSSILFDDGYDSYYANRLWQLLPGVYRALDSDTVGVDGPLQELVTRIGAQIAVVRRSIDRLWADQSIETCDDWVIPYMGNLLDVNLVDGLDATAQRLEVAKTIYYRRRKGTVAILEEIATDVTGCQAVIVEAFRRLARNRHSLDPPVGAASAFTAGVDGSGGATITSLLGHEGVIGSLTGTLSGGTADLRSAHGAALTGSPFDEFAHTVDVRAGQGAVGLYGIGKLLVFLWRLQAFPVAGVDPVAVAGCPEPTYVFDPTGRCAPLFMQQQQPTGDDFADSWTAALEWQVPGPLTDSFQRALGTPTPDYPDASNVYGFYAIDVSGDPLSADAFEVTPETGQFTLSAAPSEPPVVAYHYGFPAMIGAGTYDRTQVGDPPSPVGTPVIVTGVADLADALNGAGGTGTIQIGDSRTYASIPDVGTTAAPITEMVIQAGSQERPLVRLPPPGDPGLPPTAWVLCGGGDQALADEGLPSLTLDGLMFSGGDIVLRGAFASVRLTGFTADPGTAAADGSGFAQAVDGVPLSPTRIWIEADPDAEPDAPGAIEQLTIDHCVLGSVRTRNGGAVANATVTDTIIQGLAPEPASDGTLESGSIHDPALLAALLASGSPLAGQLVGAMPAGSQKAIAAVSKSNMPSAVNDSTLQAIVTGLNALIGGSQRLDQIASFAGVPVSAELSEVLASPVESGDPTPDPVGFAAVNLALLEAAFPLALAPAALALADASVSLERVSVIGSTFVHRLSASDSIITDFSVVEDVQDGCVRYSAVSVDSYTPRQYNSALVATDSSLFTSTFFGHPAYGQLLETADSEIVSAPTAVTITAGASTGSEMGAYSSGLAPVKERGLLVKYAEYMPLGLTPVIVHVT
jgi:hypothetical protein